MLKFLFLILVIFSSNSSFAKKQIDENDMLAAADVNAGKEGVSTCMACHSFKKGGGTKVGPNLFGIFGAKQARRKEYNYSPALMKLRKKNARWTVDNLAEWIRDPQEYAPGTKMSFPGILDPQDRMDVIAYLMTLK